MSFLKNDCGCQFTSKLEGMFKDISLSGSLMEHFRDHLNVTRVCGVCGVVCGCVVCGVWGYLYVFIIPQADMFGVDLGVRVLTMGYWPSTSNPVPCVVPLAASKVFDIFKRSLSLIKPLLYQLFIVTLLFAPGTT